MLFNSYVFILAFLPIALAGFFWSSKLGRQAAGSWLVIVSLVFYSWWNPAFLPLLLISILANFGMSELIVRYAKREQVASGILTLAIGLNLLALFYFKYYVELVRFVSAQTGWQVHVDPILLPLGISFFTFTQIGYLVDVKQGVAKERGFLNYLLFVTFFPHLIAGPILHNREMMPQFAEEKTYRFSLNNFSVGLTVFILGLFKKTVLADPLSPIVSAGFANPADLSLFESWRIALMYSLQLYFDFSGYSDMAIGLARMFNVRFPLNFNSPFKSQSVTEYWQRWHMTLTRYLNLYLYNPIALAVVRWRGDHGYGTKRADQKTAGGFLSMTALPTLLTMTLIGLWHGAGLQFLLFGLLHGCYLTFNNAMRMFYPPKPAGSALAASLRKTRNILLTYFAVVTGLVLFRAPSLDHAFTLLAGMTGQHGFAFVLRPAELAWMGILYAVVWGFPNVQQIMGKAEPAIGKVDPFPLMPRGAWYADMRWAIAIGALFAASVLAMGGTSEFLYFQF